MKLTAETEKFTMDYCRFGNGKRVFVLIPGLSTGPLTPMEPAIAANYAAFTEEFTVYMFDRRNEIPESYSIEEMAEDTALVMKQLGLEDVCLYGSSQGGMISLVIAERHPELVHKLIIASSCAKTNEIGTKVLGKWIDIAKKGDGKELNTDMIYNVYSPEFINKYNDLMQSRMVPMSKEALKRFITLAEPIFKFDHYEGLSNIKCHVLVIGCEGDKVFSAQPSVDMAEKLSCELFIYGKEYGHAVYDEAPDCFMRVLKFVTEK